MAPRELPKRRTPRNSQGTERTIMTGGQEEEQHVEISRKRTHDQNDEAEEPEQQAGLPTPPSKRRRSSKGHWPVATEFPLQNKQDTGDNEEQEANDPSGRSSSQAGRSSRFQEGSMNDKPSQKPPSLFTRVFHSNALNKSLATENLVEDYQRENATPTTAYANQSILSLSSNAANNGSPTKSNNGSRLGRTFASLKPSSIWSKMYKNWKEAEEEAIRRHNQTCHGQDTRARAEATYAAMKASGQLGGLGSKAATHQTGLANGYTPTDGAGHNHFRDSGIGMVESASSTACNHEKDAHPDQGEEEQKRPRLASRRSLFSFHRPSFQNLKKIKSSSQLSLNSLNPMAWVSSPSLNPLGQDKDKSNLASPGEGSALRNNQSKRDLRKQNKIANTISALEEKLEVARHELAEAVDKAGVSDMSSPAGPSSVRRRASELFRSRDRKSGINGSRPRHMMSGGVGTMPTLPSERLLVKEPWNEKENGSLTLDTPSVSPCKRWDENEKENATVDAMNKGTKAVSDIHKRAALNRATSTVGSLPKDGNQDDGQKMTRGPLDTSSTAKNKRKSADQDDLRFQGESASDYDHDDAAWDGTQKSSSKRRRVGRGILNGAKENRAEQDHVEGGANISSLSQTKSSLSKAPAPRMDAQRKGREHEEVEDEDPFILAAEETMTTFTSTTHVALNDEPSRPTATATPAHPINVNRPLKARFLSPPQGSMMTSSPAAEGTPLVQRESSAPYSSPSRSRSGSPNKRYHAFVDEEVQTAVPGEGEVPAKQAGRYAGRASFENALPVLREEGSLGKGLVGVRGRRVKGDEFEWPADVF